jgi:mannose-6-phosphate isomerase
VRPLVLPPNGVPRFYRGGAAIAALRGVEPAGERVPEDWVGSTTAVFGETELGLSRLADGRLLRDAAAADPAGFFGPEHAARFGAEPALLVKLLDAGERLPVHVHPDRVFARELLDSPYGKTEAWIVIGTAGPTATMRVGFREDVDAETLARWVRDQDSAAMIDALNPVEVRAGDAIFVPAGVPHAIGEGALIVELQEPSDLSILLEWRGFMSSGDGDARLGLDWETALRSVDRSRREASQLYSPRSADRQAVTSLLPSESERFFRAEWVEAPPSAKLDRGFAIVVVTEGAAELHPERGEPHAVGRGDALLLPWGAGPCRLEGEAVAVVCRPPADGGGGPP